MFTNTQIAFIGSGAMAEAIIHGILDKQLVQPGQIVASDVRAERLRQLEERYGLRGAADNREAVQAADIIVLSVKPQVLGQILSEAGGLLREGQLVLSIVAGASIETIADALGHRAIVRVMPNTPAQVGAGMSVWTATAEVSEAGRAQAQAILAALGEEIYVPDEHYLDMATAVNGSGPGFIFLLLEGMVDAAVHLGFARPVAETLVIQTALGSALYAKQSGKHLAELRNMVTSPGGTTAEGLYHLEERGVRAALAKAIWAAYEKSVSLGALSKKKP